MDFHILACVPWLMLSSPPFNFSCSSILAIGISCYWCWKKESFYLDPKRGNLDPNYGLLCIWHHSYFRFLQYISEITTIVISCRPFAHLLICPGGWSIQFNALNIVQQGAHELKHVAWSLFEHDLSRSEIMLDQRMNDSC